MYYLYGAKRGVDRKLVATFGSEQQLLAYVRWATLSRKDQRFAFEQGSALAGYEGWSHSAESLIEGDPETVPYNPSPAML